MKRRKLKAAPITLAKTSDFHDLRHNYRPGIVDQEGNAPVEVDDPENPGKKIGLVRSIKDPLTYMRNKGAIEEPHFLAGEYWRICWYKVQYGISSIDTQKESVDGGRIYEPLPDMKAHKFLEDCKNKLGEKGNTIIRLLLAHNLFPYQIAALYGQFGDRSIRYFTGRVRECLQDVSLIFTVRK